MGEMNVVPIYRPGFGEIKDGIVIGACDFCKKNVVDNDKCTRFYKEIFDKCSGFYKCPYGFAAYVFEDYEKNKEIFTGCRIKGTYDAKTADPKTKRTEWLQLKNTILTEEQIKEYAALYLEYQEGIIGYEKHKSFTEEIVHDLRKFNNQVKVGAEKIFGIVNSNSKFDKFKPVTANINSACNYMTLRLNCYDFFYNKALMSASPKSTYNMYHSFDKSKRCLDDRLKEKNSKVKIIAPGNVQAIEAHDCVELLPYILLDNAIKYNKKGTDIIVDIVDSVYESHIQVKSISLYVNDKEIEKLCLRGYRGEQAKRITRDGMGIGLYTVQEICNLHKYDLKISSNRKDQEKDMEYCEFCVDIDIKKEYSYEH